MIKKIGYRVEQFEVRDVIDECTLVKTPDEVFEVFKDTFGESEEMYALFLNIKNRVLTKYQVIKGTYNSLICSPADILVPALRFNARNIILAHNHPSDDCTPSAEDITFTKKIDRAFEICGVNLLDHLIITDNCRDYYSFKKHGVI